MMIDGPGTPDYLATMASNLLCFGAKSVHARGGFGYLDQAGRIDPAMGQPLWITCRMTHCFALGALLDHPGAAALADHGLAALAGQYADRIGGGWHGVLDDAGYPASNNKEAYGHAFVVLAAATAVLAARPGAQDLLDQALAVMERHFWEPGWQMVADQASQDFSRFEPYRGANANMHTVEAFLAAAVATGNELWSQRALAICQRLINHNARANHWRIPEHYGADWVVDLDHNRAAPADQFRPYGATPGHGFEWARLLLQLEAHLGEAAPSWMRPAALELYDRASSDGWEAEPTPGLVYTTDWDGVAVLRERLHWVIAEATAAAAVLHQITGLERYMADYQRWWRVVDQYFVDRKQGAWFQELSPQGQPSARLWTGKPDVYHALQTCLIPMAPISPAVAVGLRAAGLS